MSHKKDPKSRVISYHFRVSRSESRSMKAAASARGTTISDWIRSKVLNFESKSISSPDS